jgi:hypothetical protein
MKILIIITQVLGQYEDVDCLYKIRFEVWLLASKDC